ncbi:uracil-DNA glycosylase family protein [Aquitalea sp. LB_tupeE]|uniref:uracil-DNA glycosylase n=1 Tax=Aquitalea sp. LB_tupeE TaxID=2748078 RepID=UPI0015B7AA7D|nr:uracil-DNA glycosylase [Aquitalea sp. LB_tupeE]NWK78727.1 uracil-DNA glycosylase [Aquitalea sp. LB_tupeE]
MNRSRFIQQAIGLGPIWESREGWFADHPAEISRQALIQAHHDQAIAELHQPASTATATAPAVQPAAPILASEKDKPQPVSPATTVLPAVASPIGQIPSWEQLEQTVANCERCTLCRTRTQTVFGRGNPQARWMLIGEAPGEHEDRQGEPFVGKAGQLLDNMLAAAGLDRDRDVYIANVLKCRPPGNRNPAPEEILACQGYLQQQIQHVRPVLIVALGRFAVQTLLQSEQAIGKLRGQVHQYQGIPLIATYHPAYLLRNLPDKAKAWQDMVLAKQQFSRLTQTA